MDKSKKAAFVKKMGKKKLKLKREHFDGGGIAGLLGSAGGMGGTGFDVTSGTTGKQINDAYDQNQIALGQSQGIASALQPQVTSAVNAQNTLDKQYADQALGLGPNVAVNQLNQATGANVANTAALMAGARGASSNPALIARQAAMSGANAQQQAAGQAATLQAQQQIAAEGARQGLAGNQIAQAQGATNANIQANQGEQGILQGANTANNNVQGQLANTTLGAQQGMFTSAIGGIANGASGAMGALGMAKGGVVPTEGLDFVHKMTKMGLEHHGKNQVKHFDQGGEAEARGAMPTFTPPPPPPSSDSGGGGGGFPIAALLALSDGGTVSSPVQTAQDSMRNAFHFADGGGVQAPGEATQINGGEMHPHFKGENDNIFANYFMAKGGEVPAMVSPGEVYLEPEQVHQVIHGNEDPKKIGMMFKGKAKVKGDSRKNDTIPATLREGGVVVDREHMGTPEKRKLFVHRAIAKRKAGSR